MPFLPRQDGRMGGNAGFVFQVSYGWAAGKGTPLVPKAFFPSPSLSPALGTAAFIRQLANVIRTKINLANIHGRVILPLFYLGDKFTNIFLLSSALLAFSVLKSTRQESGHVTH